MFEFYCKFLLLGFLVYLIIPNNLIGQNIVKDQDGNSYTYQLMKDGKYWMTKNLSTKINEARCYGDEPQNCLQYGRLYNWDDAKAACDLLGNGWHLPSDEEWKNLTLAYGGYGGDGFSSGKRESAYNYLLPGAESGFDAQFGGIRYSNEEFLSINENGFYWTSTENNSQWAWMFYFNSKEEMIYRFDYDKFWTLSCRCTKDTDQ